MTIPPYLQVRNKNKVEFFILKKYTIVYTAKYLNIKTITLITSFIINKEKKERKERRGYVNDEFT